MQFFALTMYGKPLYRLVGPEGMLDWQAEHRGSARALFHYPVNPYPGEPEFPTDCPAGARYGLPASCFPEPGGLYDDKLLVFRAGDVEVIRGLMQEQFEAFARDVRALREHGDPTRRTS